MCFFPHMSPDSVAGPHKEIHRMRPFKGLGHPASDHTRRCLCFWCVYEWQSEARIRSKKAGNVLQTMSWHRGHTSTHLNTLHHTATNYIALHRTATHCDAAQITSFITPSRSAWHHDGSHHKTLQHTLKHCNTLRHHAKHCNILQHFLSSILWASHCITPQNTTTHCNTLQHTATYCNTLQHTSTHFSFVLWGRTPGPILSQETVQGWSSINVHLLIRVLAVGIQ